VWCKKKEKEEKKRKKKKIYVYIDAVDGPIKVLSVVSVVDFVGCLRR
jgi:hypothetical protein